jgi:alkylated DNA repair dioxygenase AlkB
VSFGWRYDFNERELQQADDMPPFLLPLRQRAAAFAALPPSGFQHALVTEYSPGAAIGWHRDKAVFAEVVGVSLLAPCRFRFRRKQGSKWERASLTLEPRSAYLLRGPARSEWEHSIPDVDRLRYSITFRNFPREGEAPAEPRPRGRASA